MSATVLGWIFIACLSIASATPRSKSSLTPPEVANTLSLPAGYIYYPKINAAFKVHHQRRNYNDAKQVCVSEGGRLAVVDTLEKVQYVKANKPRFTDAWVGIIRDNSHWVTADSSSRQPQLPWEPNRPDDFGDCAVVNVGGTGISNRVCIWSRLFVCEILIPPKVQLI